MGAPPQCRHQALDGESRAMGCCQPKPQPPLGEGSSELLPRWDTCHDLDVKDRGYRITVFVGLHHKVKLWVKDDYTMQMIKERVEEILSANDCWDGDCKIDNLMHRHQLPIYQVAKHTHKHDKIDEEVKVEFLDFAMEFKDVPDIQTYKFTSVMESVHFLAVCEDPKIDVDTSMSMEATPEIRFVDHMGMEQHHKYWQKPGNYVLRWQSSLKKGLRDSTILGGSPMFEAENGGDVEEAVAI